MQLRGIPVNVPRRMTKLFFANDLQQNKIGQ